MLALSLAFLLAAPPAEPTDTKVVLLLDDLSVVEAEPTKGGYAVRRGKELEPVAAARIKFVGDSKAAVQKYLLSQAVKPAEPPAGYGVHSRAVPGFVAQTQAILLNRCASCHAKPTHPGGFKLANVAAGFADPDATARNTRAAGLQLDRQTPGRSPLLTFAVTAHGGATVAPLAVNQPAYAALERWVLLAAAPQPGERRGSHSPSPAPSSSPQPASTVQPRHTPPTADPTDPGPFNRAVHPERPSSPTR